jgi:membrane-associated phospholipid phosphatase
MLWRVSSSHTRGSEILAAAVLAALFVGAQATDRWWFHHFAYHTIYDREGGQMLRLVGYAPVWMLGAFVLILHDRVPGTRQRQWGRRGLLLIGCPAVAGLAADVLKLLFRRERPYVTDGLHVFRPWSVQPFSTAELGLPSGEGAVAFAAAAILARLFPEAKVVWYALAAACALTRVAAGAHFMSDVVLAALLGYAVTVIVWRRYGIDVAALASPDARS